MRLLGPMLTAVAVLAWPSPSAHLRSPLRPAIRSQTRGEVVDGGRRARHWLVCAAAGLCVALAWGDSIGLISGLILAVGGPRLLDRADALDVRRRRRRRAEDLPAALDLVGVCLRSGQPVDLALSHVAAVLDGPLGEDLGRVCALYGLGADARSAWSDFGTDPVLAPVARALARSGASGSAVATALAGVAEQCRFELQEEVEVAARRVGVFVLAPLGLCFLPAFVCLGVVPTILGVADSVLG